MEKQHTPDRYISMEALAERWGIDVATLHRYDQHPLPALHLARRLDRYNLPNIEALEERWLKRQGKKRMTKKVLGDQLNWENREWSRKATARIKAELEKIRSGGVSV